MTDEKKNSVLFSTRFFVALTGFAGCFVLYSFRINLSVALVCMVNHTALELHNQGNESSKVAPECEKAEKYGGENTTVKIEGHLDWDKRMQGILLSAFFWGYLCTQILGGWAAQKFGGTKIIALNVFVSALVTFFTPVSTKIHFAATVFLRIVLGFVQGVTFPAFHTFWSVWSPPMERSILTGITYAGCQVGNVITLPLSSFLCQTSFLGGWPSIFYVLGLIGTIWLALWFFYASDTPDKHRFMSAEEKRYIVQSLTKQTGKAGHYVSVPWKAIFKSAPVYAALAAHWSGDWAAYMMLTCIPSFLKDVFQVDMTELGLLAAVPYIAYFLCINISGIIADNLRSKHILSTTNTRKIMTAIAFIPQAGFLVAAGYCGCGQQYLVIAFLTLGAGFSGFQYAGVLINYMDMAPRFAGTVLGIGNTISCLSGILSSVAMGELTRNGTRQEWLTLFWITAVILITGTVIFAIFAQGEVQSWAAVEAEGAEMESKVPPVTTPSSSAKSKSERA